MRSIGIVTDSHSGIDQSLAAKLGVMVLPMPFYVNEECYYEESTLTRAEFFRLQESGASVTTSQPSPASVMEIWDKTLQKYEKILYMPISSGLSGSCAAAQALASDDPYEGRVLVVDHGRVSTPLVRMIMDALELIHKGLAAEEIRDILEKHRADMVIYLGVQTLEYLKRGGRITPATAALGTLLNIKPVLQLDTEKLDAIRKCHGFIKAKHFMIETLKHDLETRFKEAYEAGRVHLLAASSATQEETAEWVEEIRAAFPGHDVLCGNLSLGICCHTGPGALGIGCSCSPKLG